MRGTTRAAIGVSVVGLLFSLTVSAQACSIAIPPPLLSLLEDEASLQDISGIYEQTTVAWPPSILVRSGATASVVSRYWGGPPANTGIQDEGGAWFPFLDHLGGSSCAGLVDREGNVRTPDGPIGTLGYGVVARPGISEGPLSPEEAADQGSAAWHRSAPELPLANGDNTGELSSTEAALLEDTFGAPVLVDITAMTRIGATLLVWWPIALVGILVWGASRLIWRRLRRRESRARDNVPGYHN